MKSLLETVDFTFDYSPDHDIKPLTTSAKAKPEKKKKMKTQQNNSEEVPMTFSWDRKSKEDYIRRINEAEEKRKEEVKAREDKRKAYRSTMREKIIKDPTNSDIPENNLQQSIEGIYGPKKKRYGPDSF